MPPYSRPPATWVATVVRLTCRAPSTPLGGLWRSQEAGRIVLLIDLFRLDALDAVLRVRFT